ncbi:hypothetical protein M0E87_08770 [Corynebacterium sp. CCM 9185]|uniref:Uncharacterized protein n=1 Tax=Corynebacterium marambiense TaxID=2765364 RepID=A0ABS0W0L7_9CORY|nr:hypothetical protein [Corynebacterium marambiense]MBI9001188.1 hypothetical protein [Corynebacterium marambiense]MCK7663748.1 hypothetical protein [Corynebacterium marambiense]
MCRGLKSSRDSLDEGDLMREQQLMSSITLWLVDKQMPLAFLGSRATRGASHSHSSSLHWGNLAVA